METVVLVHGLWVRGWELSLLRRRLEASGFATERFSYRSVAETLEDHQRRLVTCLERTAGEPVHLLGHSLGGVVVVSTLQNHPFERLGRVLSLGAPLQGSHAARAFARWPGGRRLLGKSAPAFEPSPLPPWTVPADLGVIAGSLPLGGGQLLRGLAKPNDGTIAVEETHLAGEREHLVLPVSHYSMVWSREVAARIATFFRTGRFDPADGPPTTER